MHHGTRLSALPLATYRYNAFGAIRSQSGSSNTYGFTSRENEATLMYYRTRYYDLSVGRFTSSDSAGACGGYNRYAYVGNNPTNRIDPSGRISSHLFDGGGGFYAKPSTPIEGDAQGATAATGETTRAPSPKSCLLPICLVVPGTLERFGCEIGALNACAPTNGFACIDDCIGKFEPTLGILAHACGLAPIACYFAGPWGCAITLGICMSIVLPYVYCTDSCYRKMVNGGFPLW